MIITRLNGGLGNQLFQYSAGFALAERNQDILKIDLSGYSELSKNAYRKPDLLSFNIGAELATAKEIEAFRNPYGLLTKLKRTIDKKFLKRYYHDWHPEVMSMKGNVYLDGYFQSEMYFKNVFDKLGEQLTLTDALMVNVRDLSTLIKQVTNSVSVHIRRGDYVDNPKTKALHDICTADYFYRAINLFEQEFENITLVVFSDDIDWVKNNLNWKNNTIFVSDMHGKDGVPLSGPEELFLMSCCKNNIISNSTFSWWGAYLNQNQNKKVVAPSLWNRSSLFEHQNITPKGWIKLSV